MSPYNQNIARHSFAIMIAVLFIAGGCGGSKNPTNSNNNNPPPVHSAHFHNVVIQNFAFSPASLSVAAGDTVNWTNNDSVTHTVTSDTGTELQSPGINQNGTYQHVFQSTGVFAYHCTIHTTMHGSVTAQ